MFPFSREPAGPDRERAMGLQWEQAQPYLSRASHSGNEPLHMAVHPKGKEVDKERRTEKEEGVQPNFTAREQQVGQKVQLEEQRRGSFISGILLPHLHHLSPRQWGTYHKCTHPAHQQKQANAIRQCLPLRICHLQIHHMWQINGMQASLSPVYTQHTVWPNSMFFWETENENKPQRMKTSDRDTSKMTVSAGRYHRQILTI